MHLTSSHFGKAGRDKPTREPPADRIPRERGRGQGAFVENKDVSDGREIYPTDSHRTIRRIGGSDGSVRVVFGSVDQAVSQSGFGSSFQSLYFQNSNFDPTYWTLRRSLFLSWNDGVAEKMDFGAIDNRFREWEGGQVWFPARPQKRQIGCRSRRSAGQSSLSERFGDNLPFVFVYEVTRTISSYLLYENSVALENSDHSPDARDLLVRTGLKPANPTAL